MTNKLTTKQKQDYLMSLWDIASDNPQLSPKSFLAFMMYREECMHIDTYLKERKSNGKSDSLE